MKSKKGKKVSSVEERVLLGKRLWSEYWSDWEKWREKEDFSVDAPVFETYLKKYYEFNPTTEKNKIVNFMGETHEERDIKWRNYDLQFKYRHPECDHGPSGMLLPKKELAESGEFEYEDFLKFVYLYKRFNGWYPSRIIVGRTQYELLGRMSTSGGPHGIELIEQSSLYKIVLDKNKENYLWAEA